MPRQTGSLAPSDKVTRRRAARGPELDAFDEQVAALQEQLSRPEEPKAVAPRRLAFLAPTSPVPIIAGIVVAAVGFVLIAIAWAKVAAETNVALQLPYLVSAGMSGLALVMVGLLMVNLSVKRQDAAERSQQMGQLAEILRDLKGTLDR